MGGAPYKFAEKGSGALSNVSEFSHKRALMSCFNNLMPLKQMIEQTTTYKFMFSSYHWHHIMLYYLWCHCEHGEGGGGTALAIPVFMESIKHSFLPSQTLSVLISHMLMWCEAHSRVGTHSRKLWSYTGDWGVGTFWGWVLFRRTMVCIICVWGNCP